jgi:hypothetical protein
MSRIEFCSHWLHLKKILQQDLVGLTDGDLASCGGRRDRLIEKLQQVYGIPVDEAEGALMHYERRAGLWYSPAPCQAANN